MRDLTDKEIQNVYGAGGTGGSSYGGEKKHASRQTKKTRRTDYSRKNTRKTKSYG